jgi:hypothetical protein
LRFKLARIPFGVPAAGICGLSHYAILFTPVGCFDMGAAMFAGYAVVSHGIIGHHSTIPFSISKYSNHLSVFEHFRNPYSLYGQSTQLVIAT